VAFVRAESTRGITDIFVVPASGGNERRLTADRKTVTGLAWVSNDRIVFNSNRQGANRLWSLSARGGSPELVPIPTRDVRKVSASSRTHRLALTEYFVNSNLWRLDLRRKGTPAEKLIATTRRNDSPKYSPDGTRIVFGSDRSGTYELWLADANGKNLRKLTSFGGSPVGTPRWSPDGKQIAFDAGISGRSVIYTIAVEGASPKVFMQDAFDNMMPGWSRDGRFIYYASPRDGALRAWKKPSDGGPAIQLTHRAGGEAVESADGAVVYFSNGSNGIWQVSPDGANEAPVPGLEQVHHSRYFVPEPHGLYFLTRNAPPFQILFFDFMSRRLSPVASIVKQIPYGTPSLTVSPDEHWLLYSQVDDGGSDILMVEDF
jgi:Tol biopolymer transport system component